MCAQLSVDERRSRGAEAAAHVPHQAHRGWAPAAGRRSPVGVLADQEGDRLSDLVPVRHGRMLVSPFTFYRGAAAVMAEDLRGTPVAGLPAQLCGDAHLSNFGVFGSPERRLVFDVNDFDETLPGPFEYDVKRMVASFVIAARDNGFSAADGKAVARQAAAAYRTAMAEFAGLGTMDVWYASLDEDKIKSVVRGAVASIGKAEKSARSAKEKKLARKQAKQAKKAAKVAAKAGQKAHTRDSLQALSKLGEQVGGQYRIVSQPPVVIPLRELAFTMAPDVPPEQIEAGIRDQFRAYRSTLEPDRQHGQRVVQGQRLMQAASDIYLGPYARLCAWTLARAHARSGDPVAIAAYLGEDDTFDRAVTDFGLRYADQNERDYAQFAAAVKAGELPVIEGV